MTEQLSIFDQFGRIKNLDNPDDLKRIEALDDAARETLFNTVSACNAKAGADDRAAKARSEVLAKQDAYSAAVKFVDALSVSDRLRNAAPENRAAISDAERSAAAVEAQRAAVRAFNGIPAAAPADPRATLLELKKRHDKLAKEKVPDQVAIGAVEAEMRPAREALQKVTAAEKAQAALADADKALAEARQEYKTAVDAQRALEKSAGAAIDAWRVAQNPPSDLDARRSYIASSAAERARRIAAGLTPQPIVVAPEPKCELERVMMARGGHRTPRFRGQQR
jgi:hypothetical protein